MDFCIRSVSQLELLCTIGLKVRSLQEQIIGFLRQAEAGMPIKETRRKHGFSDASFYKWRSTYGGMDTSAAKRLRELELENGKLKRRLAEVHLDIHAAELDQLAFDN